MDDYNVNVLSEAKNEYSSRLLNIMTPLVLLGIKSIFTEAVDLCEENNEDEKYLMTFQNFLSRVPKWNANIIKEETKRIVEDSKCPYLEDLLTCVHITQLKILTSIRVSNHQKKIEIDIPKLEDFVHNVYINFARKLYTNIYLFEKDVMPLTYQKNMREAEIICRECILKVIRDSMPIEQILRAYMDESVHDEIVEETLEKQVTEDEAIDMLEEAKKNNENSEENTDAKINKIEKIDKDNETTVSEPKLVSNNDIANEALKEVSDSIANDTAEKEKSIIEAVAAAAAIPKPSNDKENAVSNNAPTEVKLTVEARPVLSKSAPTTPVAARPITPVAARPITPVSSPRNSISFSDNDNVLDMGTNKESTIHAPKTEKRLAEISRIANAKRKQEEEDDDYDDDDEDFDDDGPLKIGGSNIKLDIMDIQDISKDLKINKNPILDDIEVLA